MSLLVSDAVERWREVNVPPTMLNGRPSPSCLEEAQDWRSAAVIEQRELEAKMAASSGRERDRLKVLVTAVMARISAINDWIVKARKCAPMRAGVSLTAPVLAAEVAATLAVTAPVFPNRCACGEEVEPERLRASWVFYCQRCGADWSAPAPLEVSRPKPRKAVKRCACAHKCRFCGGER